MGFHSLRELDALLPGVPGGGDPQVLVAPGFVDWRPPEVETYVRPDADGVARGRLAYHVSEPD